MDLRRHSPNLLSGLRMALVPVLLWLAWTSHPTAFLWTFAFSLSTDLLDGYLARRFRSGSELGAKLDSWGDLATYSVFPLCAWWLFRESMVEQWMFVIAGLVAFAAPTLIGLAKFRRITSYHTRLAKAVAVVMGAGLILYLGFDLPVLFHAAVLFLLVEAIEEIAITAILPEWRANVPSVFAALQIVREAKPALMVLLLVAGFPMGVTAGTALPDLVPEVSNVDVEYGASVSAGDVAEGCTTATTGRDLVRLDLTTLNKGPGSLELGDPMCPVCATHPGAICGHPDFECSPAGGHNHPHYLNFLHYELVDPDDVVVAEGGKRSFCLAETMCPDGSSFHHDCNDQGLDPGCFDTYESFLGCQYVDATDVPDGLYFLRITVDPLNRFAEVSESNNTVEFTDQPVVIARTPPPPTPLAKGGVLLKPEHTFKVRARAASRMALEGATSDPTLGGATLYVSDRLDSNDVGDLIGFDLPASGWRRIGKPSDPRAFLFKGKRRVDGGCSAVMLTRGEMRAACNLRGEHTHFDTPVQGKVFVELRVGAGDRRFCASFGGKTLRNDAVLVRRSNAEPTDCDTGQ
jgi:CDP-diacylglycerol--glycerol-3-phosphate 3-phosphatidyltransferase